MLLKKWSLLLFFLLYNHCAGWLDERPTFESVSGNLFISSAKDKNITLKTLGNGNINLNDINLLHAVWAAQNASRLIERWKSGILDDVESTLQRLSHIVEGPNGLVRKINAIEFAGDSPLNSSSKSLPETETTSSSVTSTQVRSLSNRLRRLEVKVRTINMKLRLNECASDPCQNGGTCIDRYDSFQCHCPPEWEGQLCTIDVNECERYTGKQFGCQNGATCVNLPGSFSCTCPPGWHGFHCATQKSVCDQTSNAELCGHGVCVKINSPLGYTCICDAGWDHLSENDPSCRKDIDECTVSRYPCSVNPLVTCHNVPGTFYCGTCPPGYTGDGFKCQDIDECLVNNGGCSTSPSVECINTLGSRKCGMCPSGYQGDGVTCFYAGSCATNNGGCHKLAYCREGPEAEVLCLCPSGYEGNGKGPQGCKLVENACKSNPCIHGTCHHEGFSDFRCVCNEGYTGTTCATPLNKCDPNPCQNNGTCRIALGRRVCDCTAGFTGPTCAKQRQACGGFFRGFSGYVEFPIGAGNKYDHGLSCAWVLLTNSSMVFNITFTRFALEYPHYTGDCKNDYLQIHDGRTAGDHMIGRYCGNKLPNNGTIISSRNAVYIWFHSDNSVNNDGFAFNWTSIPFNCGGEINAEYGSISSPGYPGKYPNNRDCFWNINVSPGKRITLHFISLMLEVHSACLNDYVEVNETNYIGDQRIGLYCNHTIPAPITTTGSHAVVHFHSDNFVNDYGFHLSFLSIPGSPDCGGVYTNERGEITSPGYTSGSYRSDMVCDWEIRLPEGSHVRITWLDFNLEDSRNCRFDSVQVFEGTDARNSPLVGRYCGPNLPPQLSIKSNRVLIRLESDANVEEKGFSLKYEVECGGTFTEPSGIIQSPFYPNYYPASKECVYLISQPPGKAIVLTFEFMDIEEGSVFSESNDTECYFDRLEIRDGDVENSTLLTTVCGSMHSMPTEPIYSTYNYMFLKFFTDASINNRGFKANYTTIDRECGGIIKDPMGTLTIPGPTEQWHYNLNCLWTIRAPPNHVIELTWINFPTIQSSISDQCSRNYIELIEGYGSSESTSLGKYCSNKAPPQIMTTQENDLTINYHFNGNVADNSYQLSYFFVNDTYNCGGHYFAKMGYIRSPNYPEKYPKNKECVWIIEAENKYLVTLSFESFQLEKSPKCAYDYLEVRSGSQDNSPLLGKFCGEQVENEITSLTNQMYIKFVSDASLQKKGFEIHWNSVKTGCGGNLRTSSGSIISPNYPQNYYHRASCTWNIRVSAGSVVRITFTDFDTEEHIKCAFDYLEISDIINGYAQNVQRFCGSFTPPLLTSKSNEVKLYFRTDVMTSSRGFHLRYTTECNNKVTGFQGVIESPNFPENYERLSNCSWTITVPTGNAINITFSHFNIQTNTNGQCKGDYVQIQEGTNDQPNTELMKTCGSEEDVLPLSIYSTQNQVFISFVSDRFGTASGFRLEWYVNGCSQHLTKSTGQISSPGFPYGNQVQSSFIKCRWLIEVDIHKSIEITFPVIQTTRSTTCSSDDTNRIEIFNGETEDAPQISNNLCYSVNPVTFTSTGNRMLIKYSSLAMYSGKGFTARYKSVDLQCGGTYTGISGVIHSANYPKNYPHSQNCEWLITVDQSHAVNLTFVDLDLERSRNCTDDYIKIYDGNSTSAQLLGTHCQSSEGLPFYVSSGNQILVKMRTDTLVSAKGFKAYYNRTCGARLTVNGYGILRSSRSLHSISSLNCSWIIAAEDPSDKITLIFNHVDFKLTDDCDSNAIIIYEGEGTDGPLLGKICSNKIPKPFFSTGNTLTVYFTTKIAGDSFDATYSSFSSACGGKYTSESGVIASPNYPLSYPRKADCIWIIENSVGNRISLTFDKFELLESENCDTDYLEVRENNGIGKLRGLFCGNSANSITSSQPLWIRFKSSSTTAGNPSGFMAEYHLLFGNELTGNEGEIASPMYPRPYRKHDMFTWRITVDFNYVINIQFTDFHIDSSPELCTSGLKIYDGYDDEAPLLKEACGLVIPEEIITSSSNIVFIEMTNGNNQIGNWFHLKWTKVPRVISSETQIKSNREEITVFVGQNGTYSFTSPGYPEGYEINLNYTWTFFSPIGTHLVLKFLTMNIEESNDCMADYVAIYNGYTINSDENLIDKVCLSNSTLTSFSGINVMTVQFVSDSYDNKTGFSAVIVAECGGIIEQSHGVIELNSSAIISRPRSYVYSCEWVVKVRSGRRIKVNVIENQIETNQQKTNDNSCRSNYLMLKNGESSNSPLLGDGKYCNGLKPSVQNTTSNYLYVKLAISFASVNFKLVFRELGHDCGGRFELSSKNLQENIKSPNYPNIPTPHTECIWTFLSTDAHRLSIHFIDRFDLAFSEDCEQEYVEIRDGGTDSSPLLGRFCRNVPPSTLSTKGNLMYVRYFTDLAEPRNGFKAIITTGEVCGRIERKSEGGVITSPNYPEPYNTKSQQCSWWIVAPSYHRGIKLQFEDLLLPHSNNCSATDHITIYEKMPGSFNNTAIGTYCGSRKPGPIEILTSEAVITFESSFTNTRTPFARGFRLNYTFNNDGCIDVLRGMSGEFQTTGYPRIFGIKHCYWKIIVPEGFQVVVDVIDLDISIGKLTMGSRVSFHNDPEAIATIAVIRNSTQSMRIASSSNFMSIYYISTGNSRGMKAKFTAMLPAPCGGLENAWEGSFTSPQYAPFNESSFYCQWTVRQPNEFENGTEIKIPLTLALTISGTINKGKPSTTCRNYLSYVSIKGESEIVARICGNLTANPVTVTSPLKSYTIEAMNATSTAAVNLTINYKWFKCGGILTGSSQIIKAPKNLTYPAYCTWKVKYPDIDDTISISFEKMNLGPCDKTYIHIRGKTYRSPAIGKFCGNEKPQNIVSPANEITIEYYATENSGDFEIHLNQAKYACGGIVKGKRTEIRSPGFPQNYPNNTECIWEIEANNGYHIGLTFVERFNLETSKDCQNDYVEVYDWQQEIQNHTDHWKSMGKVCGRTPLQEYFNSTTYKMKVKFVSNDKIEGEGFRAVWNPVCGGVYEVTKATQFIQSPNFPSYYPSNTLCNYTLIAPENQEIIVDFTHFVLEGNSITCPFDNLTLYIYSETWLRDKSTWCGTNSPKRKIAKEKIEIVFRTDNSVNRDGFEFKYFLNDCGGTITEPRMISPILQENSEINDYLNCVWVIVAPPQKSVLLRFEKFNVTDYYKKCYFNYVQVFEGNSTSTSDTKGSFCGILNDHLPVIQSESNVMTVELRMGSFSRKNDALKIAVFFVNGPKQGCGGNMNITKRTEFVTQLSEFYEPLQDCHWMVHAPPGYSIEFTINKMDLRNSTFNDTIVNNHMACQSDYIEIRDGGPYAELIGHFCKIWAPTTVRSTSNLLWIRFVSDGVNEGRGVQGSLTPVLSPCGLTDLIAENEFKNFTSPNYPNVYPSDITCRWIIHIPSIYSGRRVRLIFDHFNLTESERCEKEYLQISDVRNRFYIHEGFGHKFYYEGTESLEPTDPLNKPVYRYCGSNLPHDYYSENDEVEITYKASSRGIVEHKGFKLRYSGASCSHNYTSLQGRIIHDDAQDCWITIKVPENYTISMYFNSFTYSGGGNDCSTSGIKVYDGGFDGREVLSACNYALPNPVFSTGNRLSFRAYTGYEYNSDVYDITYTSSKNGRGCGGILYHFGGTFTSPLYPNPYRNRSTCVWDVSVPASMKINLRFETFDIGPKTLCESDYLTISEALSNGDEEVVVTYCGGDNPADFTGKSNRVLVTYVTSVNNGGSGWQIYFKSI